MLASSSVDPVLAFFAAVAVTAVLIILAGIRTARMLVGRCGAIVERRLFVVHVAVRVDNIGRGRKRTALALAHGRVADSVPFVAVHFAGINLRHLVTPVAHRSVEPLCHKLMGSGRKKFILSIQAEL
jgi:hypothetical protein